MKYLDDNFVSNNSHIKQVTFSPYMPQINNPNLATNKILINLNWPYLNIESDKFLNFKKDIIKILNNKYFKYNIIFKSIPIATFQKNSKKKINLITDTKNIIFSNPLSKGANCYNNEISIPMSFLFGNSYQLDDTNKNLAKLFKTRFRLLFFT